MSMGMYFPQEEYEARWKKLEARMAESGHEIAIVWGKTAGTFERSMETAYLTNFFSSHSGQEPDSPLFNARAFCAVIFEPGKEPELHTDEAAVRLDLLATKNYHWHLDVIAGAAAALKARKPQGKVAWVGSDILPMKYGDQMRALLPEVEFAIEDDLVRDVRRIKSLRELDMFREGGALVTRAVTAMIETLIPGGASEGEAAAAAASVLLKGGGYFQRLMIGSGKYVNHPESHPMYGHYAPNVPEVGDMAHTFLYGPIWQGYWLDPGRTIVIGRKPSPAQKQLVDDLIRIMEEGIEAPVKHGVKIADVARNAARVHEEVKTDDSVIDDEWPYYGHSNGCMWEHPLIAVGDVAEDEIFEEGMVASSEAFLTREGVGTEMMETNWIVTRDGIEIITPLPMTFW